MTTFGVILRGLNIILMVGFPVWLTIKFYQRGKSGFRPIWIGILAFILSQVGHIPFNQFLLLPFLEARNISILSDGNVQILAFGVAVGLSAGIFEEITRYLVLRFWLRGDAQELLPVKYGIGHGGIEAVLTGGLALVALVQVLALGGEGSLAAFDPEQALQIQSQLEAYWAVPWQHSLLGAWERISALAFHVGASILVYKGIKEKRLSWVAVAVLGHTALNAIAVIFVTRMDLVLLEGLIFVFAGSWLFWAWQIRYRDPEMDEPSSPPPPEPGLRAPQITSKQVEESRYDE